MCLLLIELQAFFEQMLGHVDHLFGDKTLRMGRTLAAEAMPFRAIRHGGHLSATSVLVNQFKRAVMPVGVDLLHLASAFKDRAPTVSRLCLAY
ncbi:hypothetical protein CKO25_12655 [Thiocapsa imhoffii]|uniref:Uncharacterized protein n=1 Tax=Thiocapsa imhoffii TaxID=382777 RepID=A0A9X0WJ33_9GAMM|nr:hypothetical protein [Thiocapsa imhoffii]